ncbi:major facilitator superfamily domain-containing protein [Mycena galericulata]|nr:major facilitator superfamily domain-containing protein [Mycena galericulata]
MAPHPKPQTTDCDLNATTVVSDTKPEFGHSAEVVTPTPIAYALTARQAWCTLVGAFLFQFCSLGPVRFKAVKADSFHVYSFQVLAFGVFQDFYITDFLKSYSASDISWIGSVQVFLELGCGALVGKLYDAGHCRAALVGGSALFCFSFFMLSITQAGKYYQVFLSQGLGMGMGLALIFVPVSTLVSQHFRVRKALAMGILSASAPVGGVVFTIMLNQMIHHGPGFQWAVRAAAFLITGCFGVAHFLVTIIPPPPTERRGGRTLIRSIAKLPYLLTLLAGFLIQLGALFPTFYLQTFAQKHDLSESLTFYGPVIMNASSIFGRIIPNFFADHWGPLEVYIVCVGANGLVGFAMLGAGNIAGLVLFSIFFGFFFGSTVALYLPVVAVLAPQEADMGSIMGLAVIPVGIASLIGPPIGGAIIGTGLIWWKGIVFSSLWGCVHLAIPRNGVNGEIENEGCCLRLGQVLMNREGLRRHRYESPNLSVSASKLS